ncbi:MAG: DNA-directed RNA polymerase subunit alpha [Chitinophagales bacterium]|jgi:DNA-directed RNA polymerase subunit alpha|nr:DNA-directed RNA polymerase subunit alpha [Sphingobacteriales bacterium]
MSILPFQKPNKILMNKATEFEGNFEFKPLEPGFGVTIGNSIRRVLLSSLSGYAITGVKIEGIQHEFSTIPGILEDVTEMILNLKQVRFKKAGDSEVSHEKINFSIKGKSQFTAGDIGKATASFEVVNPDLVICNFDGASTLNMEISVQKGRGYVSAEENIMPEMAIGYIPIDSIFSPIRNVQYDIENFRVEQRTDFEKLNITIKTDGTIHPEYAIKEASKILVQHLLLLTDEKITLDVQEVKKEVVVDEHSMYMKKLLKTPLEDLDLSVRAFNCLKTAKIETLEELVQFDTNDLLKFRNFGRKSLVEIEELLVEKGLSFGMDIAKYRLHEED